MRLRVAFPAMLNSRHKAVFFLTLLVAGASLLLQAEAKQIAGIVLLGLAFAWAVGSDRRIVHYVFVFCGVISAGGPLLRDWYIYRAQRRIYSQQVADFQRKIPELVKEYPVAAWPGDLHSERKSPLETGLFDPIAAFKSRYAGGENEPDEKVLNYLSKPQHFRSAFPEYKSWNDERIRSLFNPVSAFRFRYADAEKYSDEQIIGNLSDPVKFRKAFPEYKSLDDDTIRQEVAARKMPRSGAGEFQYVFL